MENVVNTIKQSCEDLKSRKVIDEAQYKKCKALLSGQKWRENLEQDIFREKLDSFTKKHMDDYARFKKILDNSFDALMTVKEDKQQLYLERINSTNEQIKERIEEFKLNQQDNSDIFKEFMNKQTISNQNSKKIKKLHENVDFMNTKQQQLGNENEVETYRKVIYLIFTGLSLLMIIIISMVILYYGKYN